MSAQPRPQLTPVPTLHDIALSTGAFMDRADPSIGFPNDSYVFTYAELVDFAARVRGESNQ